MEQEDSNQPKESESEEVQEDVLATLLAKNPEPAQLRSLGVDKLNRKLPEKQRNAVYEILLQLSSETSETPIESTIHSNHEQIHADVIETIQLPIFSELSDKHKYSDILERIVSYFCSHTLYRKQLLHFLSPFVLCLPFERKVYRAFTCLLSKYVPDISLDEKIAQCNYSLFRILLQYHNPRVCLHLDSRQTSLEKIITKWFSSLFIPICDSRDSLFALIDYFLVEDDPLFYFYIGLAIIEEISEKMLNLLDSSDILSLLDSYQISNVEQLGNMAQKFKLNTPEPFQTQALTTAFRSRDFDESTFLSIKKSLCLVIPRSYWLLYHTNPTSLRFLLVDCRPIDQFTAGRLPGAKHLNPSLILENPEEFNNVLSVFSSMNGSTHFMFFGSGTEEDDLSLNLIVSRFLHARYQYVSVFQGGFKGCHEDENVLGLMVDHNAVTCSVCKSKKENSKKISEKLNLIGSAFRAKLTNFKRKEKVEEKVQEEEAPPIVEQPSVPTPVERSRSSTISDLGSSLFTIDDDELSASTELADRPVVQKPWKPVDDWKTGKNVLFEGNAKEVKGYLVVAERSIYWLIKGEDNLVQFEFERPLNTLQKITYKKRTPNLLHFVYADLTWQFEVEQAKEVTSLVHERVTSL